MSTTSSWRLRSAVFGLALLLAASGCGPAGAFPASTPASNSAATPRSTPGSTAASAADGGVLVSSVGGWAGGVPASTVAGEVVGACPWLVPVDAPVVDPYRAPNGPYGAGNRGIEYGAAVGDPVQAVAPGEVVYSGVVAGRRYVVIRHGEGGLRSTYGPLATGRADIGRAVAAGDIIGTAEEGLHLTARSADGYLDPQPLIEGRCGRPRLVPAPPQLEP